MTTWRDIAPTETDPEAPVTSELMKALAENLPAYRERDSTAPLPLSHFIKASGGAGNVQTVLAHALGGRFTIYMTGGSFDLDVSDDGGSSWTTFVTFSASGDINNLTMDVDWNTGKYSVVGSSTGSISTGTLAPTLFNTGPITVSAVASMGTINRFRIVPLVGTVQYIVDFHGGWR